MKPMPQAFADAVCNSREPDEAHARERRRGIEGGNGVACDVCVRQASTLWREYQRILDEVKESA